MDRQPVLVGTAGPNAGRRFPITEVGILLGRGEGCDVRIDDDNVSREHARVLVYNSGVWVRDTGSRNGVFVNAKRVVRPKQLGPGDVLNIGEHEFGVELEGLVGGDGTPPPTDETEGTTSSDAATAPLTLPPQVITEPPRRSLLAVVVLALAVAGGAVFLLLRAVGAQ